MTITSHSIQETSDFAAKVLEEISSQTPGAGATVLSLSGELGSGKTAFVKALAAHLGLNEEITSPTFVIEKIYRLGVPSTRFKKLIHIDAYRLEGGKELEKIGWKDIVSNPANLICIEWPEKVADVIPSHAQNYSFTFINETTRQIEKQ